MKTFILADRQDITRAGIRHLLQQTTFRDPPIKEVETAIELEQTLTACPDAIVVIDLHFPKSITEKTLCAYHARFPEAHWFLFSDDMQEDILNRYCANTNFSFVLKRCELNEISTALTYAIKGENFVCNPITRMLLHYRRDTQENKEHLTATEKEILKAIALGRSAKEIAGDRNLSVYTVVTHKKNIFRKLKVNNIHDATRYALKAGLVDTIEYYI